MTNEELIAQKKAQIEALKFEIAELQAPSSISKLVKTRMLWASRNHNNGLVNIKVYHSMSGQQPWNYIKRLCLELVKENHNLRMNERLYVRDLTHEEIKISARMADKMIEAWNDAIIELYGPLPDSQ